MYYLLLHKTFYLLNRYTGNIRNKLKILFKESNKCSRSNMYGSFRGKRGGQIKIKSVECMIFMNVESESDGMSLIRCQIKRSSVLIF